MKREAISRAQSQLSAIIENISSKVPPNKSRTIDAKTIPINTIKVYPITLKEIFMHFEKSLLLQHGRCT